ncbi:dipeptide/oligopeptide/nickel ABC transporter ATP-binding protein [Saccharothrix sp.]|uniref:ABC transporter ATP-binding protein n=1 Tax=Saccharothrix sp. TaxID=1873460 RepID=UPI002811B802|nr:dipeptide/oligopeptide/nickel ABC transporter ATP-binding protein [Saccharothrix sp.]
MPPAVLTAENITAGYRHPVITDISLTVHPGQTVGVAGPSGSGKSTLARVLALLHKPFSGTVRIDGTPVTRYRHRAPRALRTRIGVLFQQPRLSVDPRMTLRQAIAEPLRATRSPDRVDELADLVMLTADLLGRRAHEVSDGQLQRACLARALTLRPAFLICDEMTTMLDASTTAALVGVIRDYQHATGAGVLAISHDTALLDRWADHTLLLPGRRRTDSRTDPPHTSTVE